MVRLASLARVTLVALVALVAACSFRPGAASGDAAIHDGAVDSFGDARRDAVGALDTCLGAFEHVCVGTPTVAATLPGGPLDTDSSNLCVGYSIASQIPVCVIAGTSITAASGVTTVVRGSRPLILLSTGTITIAGTLDLSSTRTGSQGAGSDPVACAAQMVAPTASGGTGGGGAGGSFGGIGGDGEKGGDSAALGGKAPAADGSTERLRGGCPGYAGAGTTGGAGGHGGGAVYVLATGNVTVSGTINASGAGGGAGTMPGGGGAGGGTGGLLAFEANFITVMGSAKIFANGGGGGESANNTTNGNPGNEAPAPGTAGAGGSGGNSDGGNGGDGTAGMARNAMPGHAGQNTGGGGGGGGGAGLIKNYSSGQTGMTGPNVAPPPT